MKTLILVRDISRKCYTGIYGTLYDSDSTHELCKTFELPWKFNQRSVSCIPTGKYHCKFRYTITKGRIIDVLDVKDRSGIMFHVGNSYVDTDGCILVGFDYGNEMVLRSRDALAHLCRVLPDAFDLEIIERRSF